MRDAAAASLMAIAMLCFPPACMGAGRDAGAETIVRQMQAAWANVHDYRARMLIRTYRDSGSPDTQTFFYTFRKPDQIRIDFIRPHPGMVMIYPDKEGRVFIRPSGLARLFRLHLPPDSPRLVVSAGQRIDQTDLGLLIANIARSVGSERRGPVFTFEENGLAVIQTVAVDHFRPDVVTAYRFLIDKHMWLPVRVEESTPGGQTERTISFFDLEVNVSIPVAFFKAG